MIKAVLFDMIGTTVKTSSPDFIIDCFRKAFSEFNIKADEEMLKSNRGKDKRAMIEEVLAVNKQPGQPAEEVLSVFNKSISDSIVNFKEMEGVEMVFSFLKEKRIQTGVGSGLSEEIFNSVYLHLNWDKFKPDYIGISEKLGKSRPAPAMIMDMMKKLQIGNVNDFLKVGDTIADIQEGKNAGVKTAVLLSGTQTEEVLRKENPDYVLHSLPDLLKLPLWQ